MSVAHTGKDKLWNKVQCILLNKGLHKRHTCQVNMTTETLQMFAQVLNNIQPTKSYVIWWPDKSKTIYYICKKNILHYIPVHYIKYWKLYLCLRIFQNINVCEVGWRFERHIFNMPEHIPFLVYHNCPRQQHEELHICECKTTTFM